MSTSLRRRAMHGSRRQTAGRTALKEVRKLKSIVMADLKATVVNLEAAVPLVTAAVPLELTQIAEGPDNNERDSRVITLQRIVIQGQLTGGGGNTSVVRMIVFRDNSNDGTDPTAADIFGSSTVFAQGDVRTPDPESADRFKILLDRSITIGGATGNDNFSRAFKIDRKLNTKCYFAGTTGIANKGSLWYMVCHNLAASAVTQNGNSVLYYRD